MIRIISFLVATFFFVPLTLVGCEKSLETRTFQELVQNKTYWAEQLNSYAYYTEGVVIYQIYHEKMQFFVVAHPGVSKEVIEKESIVVLDYRDNSASYKDRENKTKIEVGDIISVGGKVYIAEGTAKNGEKITVPYLAGWSINKTGTVDIKDPDFEELVKIVAEQIQKDAAAFQSFLITIWGSIPALMPSY